MAANKLNAAARHLVYERIVAGDRNSEIRVKLREAGYPHNLRDQTFSEYRQNPMVVEALERKTQEAVQSGYSQRAERIQRLAKSARRFERRLAPDNESPEFGPGKPFDLVLLHKEYRETLEGIGKLVDPAKPTPINVNTSGSSIVEHRVTVKYVGDERMGGRAAEAAPEAEGDSDIPL